eukprot:TRINITY_DN13359_c0_g2_i2.p1 TRINITY_DN13359_c0_g2~~TRINITY_DN13359_c0_g2_i2.p1  ORF type:complete len:196 (-),score=22.87 TRINITY_DN13359_c0_g2_i2:42-629(-)
MFKSRASDSILSLENHELLSKYKGRILAAEDLSSSSPCNTTTEAQYSRNHFDLKIEKISTELKKNKEQAKEFMSREEGRISSRILIPTIEELESAMHHKTYPTQPTLLQETPYGRQEIMNARNKNDRKSLHSFRSLHCTEKHIQPNEDYLSGEVNTRIIPFAHINLQRNQKSKTWIQDNVPVSYTHLTLPTNREV